MSRWVRQDRRIAYAPDAPRIRHVWVDAPGGHGPPSPGLVIAWRMESQPSSLATGWSAQVAVCRTVDRLSIEWVPAEKLQPVRDPSAMPPEGSDRPAQPR